MIVKLVIASTDPRTADGLSLDRNCITVTLEWVHSLDSHRRMVSTDYTKLATLCKVAVIVQFVFKKDTRSSSGYN